MIKKAFKMAVYNLKRAKDLAYSPEELGKEAYLALKNAIKNNAIPGVQAMGQIAEEIARATLPQTPKPAHATAKNTI